MQTVTNNPLLVREHQTGNSERGISGSTLKRRFTVFNLGKQEAEVSVSVTATDKKSELLQNWCFLEPNPAILEPGDSQEVTLIFNIPQQVTPDLYNYEVLFEAPEQYPDSFFRCIQKLAVSHVEQEPEWGEAPQFKINPTSTSNEPYCIQPEDRLNIAIKVKNCSYLVDSFELTCPDLETQWYTVQYPERDLELPGLITNSDGLKLNPDKEGEINLIIHPPSLTLAGDYVRTIQLTSKNRNNLILLDALYLRVNSDDRLQGEITPELRTMPKEIGEFELEVSNLGNLIRDLNLKIEDNTGIFGYELKPKQLHLPPGETNNLSLIAKPRWFMGWRRPFWGDGLKSRFNLVADNTYNVILPETKKPPAIPRSLASGTLILSPRPRWQLVALILLGIGAVTGLIFAIWWWIFRLPPAPKIRNFEVVKTVGKDKQEVVLLNWRLKNPEQISKIGIISQGNEQEKDETYSSFESCTEENLETCIPQELAKFCQIDNQAVQCSRVMANVPEAGKYTFELQLFPKKAKKLFRKRDSSEVIDREISDSLVINSAPMPQFSRNPGLIANKSVYKQPSSELIKLEWEMSLYSKVKKLNIIGKSKTDKINAYPYLFSPKIGDLMPVNPQQRQDNLKCLRTGKDVKTCNWEIQVNNLEVEDYNFAVEAFTSANSTTPSDIIEAKNTLSVKAQPLPEIEQFALDKSTLQEGEYMAFSWEVKNPQQIENMAIKAISNDGFSMLVEKYENHTQIKNACSTEIKNNKLNCSNTVSATMPPGNYKFQLLIEPQLKQAEKIVEQTDTVKIEPKPQPFSIENITIDGQEIGNGETYLYPSQQNTPTKITVGWSVLGNSQLKIELLPLGEQTELEGSVPYYLEGDRETITLQVTNELGEQKTQSVQIQPYESGSPRQTFDNESNSTEPPNSNLPDTSNPSQLPTSDVPDTTDNQLPSIDSETIPPPPTQFEPNNVDDLPATEATPLEIAPKAN